MSDTSNYTIHNVHNRDHPVKFNGYTRIPIRLAGFIANGDIARFFVENARDECLLGIAGSGNIKYRDCVFDYKHVQATGSDIVTHNVGMSGGSAAYSAGATGRLGFRENGIFGSHVLWGAYSTTKGFIYAWAQDTTTLSSSFVTKSGTLNFTNNGQVSGLTGAVLTIEDPTLIKGVSSFSGNTIGIVSISGTRTWGFNEITGITCEYRIGGGTWKTLNTSNLSGETLDVAGFTMGFRFTWTADADFCAFGVETNVTETNLTQNMFPIKFLNVVNTLTINSSESGSLIQVFETGTQTLLASATADTLAYVHSDETVDYVVQKAGFLPQRFTGVALSDSPTFGVTLQPDPVYDASHGLTYTTDFSWSRADNELTVPTFGPTVRQVYSGLIDAFIAESSLYNTPFNIQMNGPNSMFLIEGAEAASDASVENMTDGGVRYIDTSDTATAEWVGIQSIGETTGFTGEYQQQDGSGTTDARTTGDFDELIKMYGDATHGNFDYRDHLVLKYQPNGYSPARVDVLDTYGISTLEPTLYVVAMEPIALAAATGDPAVSITITDEGATPVTWNSKDFSVTITAASSVSAEDILREINYNLSLDATYQGKDPFNWGELVIEAGDSYETIRGELEGDTGADIKGVRVVTTDGTTPHPGFTRFQADDGTYFAPIIPVAITAESLIDGTRVQIYNETTSTQIDNSLVSGGSGYSYTVTSEASPGDVIRLRAAYVSGTSAKKEASATGIFTATGLTFLTTQEDDDVYNTNAIDGSALTKFAADFVNDEIDLIVATDFTGVELYSFYMYTLTTATGIAEFFGGFTAVDIANYRVNNTILNAYLDNTTTSNIKQTDNVRIYRADAAYPVKNPTTGGGGIDVVWRNQVYIAETGVSGLTAGESAQLAAVATSSQLSTVNDNVKDASLLVPATRDL